MIKRLASLITTILFSTLLSAQETSGNPVFPGWYADPDIIIAEGKYWIYPTASINYGAQRFFDAFSSKDLIHWEKHRDVFHTVVGGWYWNALWAPCVVHENGMYYLYFGANNFQKDSYRAGIGVAVSDKPYGPFKDALNMPLIDHLEHGAKPIDQAVFKDDDGQYYMYYGGWHHCTVVKLAKDMISLMPFEDGTYYKEVTPKDGDYNEGAYMLKRKGKYYLMWSGGDYTKGNYYAAYAIGDSPLGPFKGNNIILKHDSKIATGSGHHSVLKVHNSSLAIQAQASASARAWWWFSNWKLQAAATVWS